MGDLSTEEELLIKIAASSGICGALDYYDRNGEIWSRKKILYMVHFKADRISVLLSCAGYYGMLDSLFALKLIVDLYEPDDVRKWFDDKLKAVTDYQLIYDLVEEYRNDRESKYLAYELDPKQMIFFSALDLSEYIWDKLEDKYVNSIQVTDSRIVGVWHLGASSCKNSRKYLQSLDKKVFPFMLLKAKELRDGFNTIEHIYYDVFTSVLRSYMVEALWMGNLASFDLTDNLLKRGVNEVAVESSDDFYKLVCGIVGNDADSGYISKTFVDQIANLRREYEYFRSPWEGSDLFDVEPLIPLFYLLVGENEEAYSKLLRNANSPLVSNKSDDIYVAALYRCLLVTDDAQKRNALINAYDGIYSNFSILPSYIDVISDFSDFYRKWTERIKEDLDMFYDDDSRFVCTELVVTDKICKRFTEALSMLNSSNEDEVFEGMDLSCDLVSGLVSRENARVRMDRTSLESAFPEIRGKIKDYEIYDSSLYLPAECDTVRSLKKRYALLITRLFGKEWLENYRQLKKNAKDYWAVSDKDVLCQKLLTAFRGIQSDPLNMWAPDETERHEDSLNNFTAYFLKSFYGDDNVHRELPQGYSSEGKRPGELDIVIYKEKAQFAIIESLRLLKINKEGTLNEAHKGNLSSHLDKLIGGYDPRGVATKVLTVYAYANPVGKFYDSMEAYLKDFFARKEYEEYHFGTPERIPQKSESSILHHKLKYKNENMDKEMHIFTVLMKEVKEAGKADH